MNNILPKSAKKNKLNLLLSSFITTCILISSHGFSATTEDTDAYSTASHPIYLTSDLDNPIGVLEVATAVKTLENTDSADKIELILWKPSESDNNIWYEKPGFNILSTTFSDPAFIQNKDSFTIIETKEDPNTNTEWQKVKTNVWIKKGSLAASNEDTWNNAKAVYQLHCSECHDLPQETHATANDWPEVVEEMVESTEMNNAEQNLVTKYLQLHSSDFKK